MVEGCAPKRQPERPARQLFYFGCVKRPNPIRAWNVLIPGFGVARPALEICMNRTSALQLYLLRRKCNPSAPDVVKFTRDVPGGTCVFVKSVPPPRSTYGVTLRLDAKFHFSAKGFSPIPYAVPFRCVSKNTGTTSTAYSNRPRKGPGPTASVS